jgi:group I intron endonuclease
MIENLTNGKKYIGQTVNFQKRKNGHKRDSKTCTTPLYQSIRKYGWENFKFTILIKDYTINYNFLDFWESYFINLFDTLNREKGYNLESGGNLNKVFTEEAKKNMSKAQSGKKMSEETKEKLRELNLGENNAFYGKKHKDESIQKMREKQLGKTLSEETKQKIKKSTTGDKNHFYGKKHTDEVKNLISKLSSGKNNSFYGKKHTEERNKQLSIKHKENDWNGRGKGVLYTKKHYHLTTNFNGKTKSVTVNKYKDLSIPLIICTRICMENEIDFKSNLVKDMENFVQNFDLKTINIINL